MGKDYRADMDVDKIHEEVNTKNVLAVIDYSKDTRVGVAEAVQQVEWLTREVMTLRGEVQNLQSQVGILRGEVYGGGPTA